MQDGMENLIAHKLAYSFLSEAFYEPPTRELINMLVTDDLFDSWPLETSQMEVENGLALLRQFCASWCDDDFDGLRQDYERLFIGPAKLLAVPWESVYRSPEHLLFDAQTVQVRKAYQRFGMPIPRLYVEPDDHIGLELRFIAHLCGIGLEALDGNQPNVLNTVTVEIRRFLNEHLLQWAPECLRLVIKNAKSDYYRGCAHLAVGCLAHTSEVVQLETVR